MFNLHPMIENGDIPPIPVYVDSPLALEGQAQQVFLEHWEQKPAEALRENLQ